MESHYPVRVAALGNVASDGQDAFVMFNVEGIALGYVPVVISGLQTPSLSDNQGLWLRSQDAQNFTRVWQGSSASSNDFWQVNFDRSSGTYEIVFNVEFVSATTMVAFGTPPDSWPPAPAPATAAVPASAPAPAPAPIKSETGLNASKDSASSLLLVQGVVIPVVLSLLLF